MDLATKHRAFSFIENNSFDEEQRTFEGLATSPAVDRMGDVVETMGLQFAGEVPLLLYHEHNLPVGKVRFGKPTKKGLPFVARIPKVLESGAVQERVNEAWHSVKYGLIPAVSIGFRAFEDAVERIDTGWRFLKSEILELSLVVVPAHQDALIGAHKSMDADLIALIQKEFGEPKTPALKGKSVRVVRLESPAVAGAKFVVRNIIR
jgi:HK97 family phage prohead protease